MVVPLRRLGRRSSRVYFDLGSVVVFRSLSFLSGLIWLVGVPSLHVMVDSVLFSLFLLQVLCSIEYISVYAAWIFFYSVRAVHWIYDSFPLNSTRLTRLNRSDAVRRQWPHSKVVTHFEIAFFLELHFGADLGIRV